MEKTMEPKLGYKKWKKKRLKKKCKKTVKTKLKPRMALNKKKYKIFSKRKSNQKNNFRARETKTQPAK